MVPGRHPWPDAANSSAPSALSMLDSKPSQTLTTALSPRTRGDAWARISVWALILAYVGLFGWLSLMRHWAFSTNAYDLGNVNQALWNTVHGRPLYFTNWRGVELTLATDSRLAMHVEPIYFLIAPLYWLYQQPETPLVLQTVVLALGAWPVYWLARDALRSPMSGVIFAAVYLLFPGLQAANLWEFHAVALAAPFLLFAFYFGWTGRWGLLWLFAILAMATKEEVPLTVFLMGLFFALAGLRTRARRSSAESDPPRNPRWSNPQIRHGLSLSLVAMVWFILAVFVVIPHFEGGGSPYLSYYEGLVEPVQSTEATDLSTPMLSGLATAFAKRDFNYLVDLFTPVAFLSLLSPLTLIFSLPDLAINLLSDHEPMHFVQKYHYVAPLLPGVMISAVLGAGWLVRRVSARTRLPVKTGGLVVATVVLATSLWYHYYHGYTPLARAFEPYEVTPHHELGSQIADQIPAEAAVSAQPNLNPHVSGRKTLYRFPWVGDADYVFLDVSTLASRGFIYPIVEELLDGDEFGLVLAQDGYLLLQRTVVDTDTMDGDFFDFARVSPEQARQIQYPVVVEFGDKLRLLGFDVAYGRRTEMPQTPLRFALYWEVIQPVEEDYRIGLFLVDDQRQVIGSLNLDQEPRDEYWYPTSQWSEGEIIRTAIADMPWWTEQYGSYGVAVGVLRGTDSWDASLRLAPSVQDSPLVTPYVDNATLVGLMRFETDLGGMPLPDSIQSIMQLPPQAAVQEAAWKDGVQLLGYTFSDAHVSPGQTLDVTLYWRPREVPEEDYTVFVHLVDEEGQLVAQHDARPGRGRFPTATWRPGQLIADRHPLEIPLNMTPGDYTLIIGLYQLQNGERAVMENGDNALQLSSSLVVR